MLTEPLIARLPLFASLPHAELLALSGSLRHISLKAREILFHEGQTGEHCYVVIAGQIELIKSVEADEERLLAVRDPGELFGEMSLINSDKVRTASARARMPSVLLEIPRADFDDLLCRHSAFAYTVMGMLSERLREAGNATVRELQAKNRLLLQAYQDLRAAQDQLIEKERLEHEISMAREIQERTLPRSLPKPEGFDLGARLKPARRISGDFFDFIPMGDHSLGVVVADVCGKGVPAALVMALTRSLLRAEAMRVTSPAAVLQSVNRHLLEMGDSGMFVTLVYGVLDLRSRRFVYVRAGHEAPILIDANHVVSTPPRLLGLPLGLMPDPVYLEQSIDLLPGSTLLIYTDGLTEAMDSRGGFFGSKLLHAILSIGGNEPAQALCDRLIDTVQAYHGSAPQDDDLTIAAVRAL